MRRLYTFCLYLAFPLILFRLFWRARHQAAYKNRILERFGYYPFQLKPVLWVHAVSVGEVVASVPLVQALKQDYPDLPILMTTMTPTGAARVKAQFQETVKHVYLPYDYPCAIKRFFKAFQPRLGIVIETEWWPNLLAIAKEKHTPMVLVNARLSAKSARGYARISSLAREMLANFSAIASAGIEDHARLIEMGADPKTTCVTGNIKFDLTLPDHLAEKILALKNEFLKKRFIWMAASTHQGEEEKILSAHHELLIQHPDSLLILAPRHPDRFDEVYALCTHGFKTARRSLAEALLDDTTVYLADTMGELLLFYGISDVAFVGGSLIDHGGHNILEPAALGKPIITGNSFFNFKEITELFLKQDAVLVVSDEKQLAEMLLALFRDQSKRDALGLRALNLLDANKGALDRQMAMVRTFLIEK